MNKSLNQLYKEQIKYKLTELPFNKWVEKGKELYDNYKKAEMIGDNVTFEMFANMVQPQLVLHEDGTTETKSFWDTDLGKLITTGVTVGADIIKSQQTTPTGTTTPTEATISNNIPISEKTILGLKPLVFYSITIVVVLGVSFGIYKLVSKK